MLEKMNLEPESRKLNTAIPSIALPRF